VNEDERIELAVLVQQVKDLTNEMNSLKCKCSEEFDTLKQFMIQKQTENGIIKEISLREKNDTASLRGKCDDRFKNIEEILPFIRDLRKVWIAVITSIVTGIFSGGFMIYEFIIKGAGK